MSFTSLKYHVVFSTKGRVESLDGDFRLRLYDYLGGIVKNVGGCLIAANGPGNHIHLAVEVGPQVALVDFVRDIKANSSKWVHETFEEKGDFGWQDGYSAFTVSASGLSQLVKYIENQEEHHRVMSFQEELAALLQRHKIEYDERYMLG